MGKAVPSGLTFGEVDMDRHLFGHIRDSRFHRPARATYSGLQQEAIARFTQAEGFSLGPIFAEIALYQCQLVISGQNGRMWHFIFSFDAVPEEWISRARISMPLQRWLLDQPYNRSPHRRPSNTLAVLAVARCCKILS
jgi:hypothetical protein